MKYFSKSLFFLVSLAGLSWAQGPSHPGYDREEVSFSPSNLFTPQSRDSNKPLVGGMDVFPDGRVAIVEWGVPGSVFIIGDEIGTSSRNVPLARFARGLNGAMGVKVVNDTIYVMEKEGLTQLVDVDGDGRADEFNSINQAFPSNNNMLNLAYDVGYLEGAFYAALSSDVHVGGMDWGSSSWRNTPALAGRSAMYRLDTDGTATEFACGFRNPNGMDINGDDIFVSDNQGSWLPSSKLIAVRQGRFYGHRTNPANDCQTENNNQESPPVAWGNFADDTEHATGRSWGSPVVLKTGPYAGQVLMGETVTGHANNVVRVFMEEIDGELQGVILPFIKGSTSKGVYRIKEGPDGVIYLGILGSNGSWNTRSNMFSGFDVLRPNGSDDYLEILAIRSMGSDSFELEFNKALGSNAGQTNLYSVIQWRNNAVEAYGGGNMEDEQRLSVSSASVTSNKVRLTINGLRTGGVVKFVLNSNMTAQDGSELWTNFGIYSLNRFGPGSDYEPVSIASDKSGRAQRGWKLTRREGFHVLHFPANASAVRDVAVYDLKGMKRLEKRSATGSEIRLETASLHQGMYLVQVREKGREPTTQYLLVP